MPRGGWYNLGSRLTALGSRLSALGSRLSALGSRLSALGSRLSALGSRLSALGSRLSALGSRLSALGSRLSALGSRLSALGSRLSALGSLNRSEARYRLREAGGREHPGDLRGLGDPRRARAAPRCVPPRNHHTTLLTSNPAGAAPSGDTHNRSAPIFIQSRNLIHQKNTVAKIVLGVTRRRRSRGAGGDGPCGSSHRLAAACAARATEPRRERRTGSGVKTREGLWRRGPDSPVRQRGTCGRPSRNAGSVR